MNLRVKNYLTIAGFTAWGAGCLWGTTNLAKIISKGKEGYKIEQAKVDSIKNEIRSICPDISDRQIKNIKHACENPQAGNRVLNWERVCDSLHVEKLGRDAIKEFNAKVAPQLYNDTVKALKNIK